MGLSLIHILSPSELCGVISSGNDKLLKTVKGIGLKTAQRIIVDLKDKIATSGVETVNSEMFANPGNTEIHDEAGAALTMLGFAQAASQKVVAAILKEMCIRDRHDGGETSSAGFRQG